MAPSDSDRKSLFFNSGHDQIAETINERSIKNDRNPCGSHQVVDS